MNETSIWVEAIFKNMKKVMAKNIEKRDADNFFIVFIRSSPDILISGFAKACMAVTLIYFL